MIPTIKQMPRSIMLECGPRCVGRDDPAINAKALIVETREKYDLRLKVLVYDRDRSLAHTNLYVGERDLDTDDVEKLYRSLNAQGLPFNLAINGSPNYNRHVPFNARELGYLAKLQESGSGTGVNNVVTIADNALVDTIREHYPGLGIVASCISAAFEPNLANFRNSHGIEYEDPGFLIKYYRHLYSVYDMVVPIPQLSTPGFLSALTLTGQELSQKTILFMNLRCGAQLLGRCVDHYKGKVTKDPVRLDMPAIPEEYIAKPEDKHDNEKPSYCKQSSSSLELMNRFGDLRSIWEMGISQFKIPARSSDTGGIFEFLCRFVTKDRVAGSIPETPSAVGYTSADIKLSFLREYPVRVHGVLRDYSWPEFDTARGDGYKAHTANSISNELHSMALSLDNSPQ